LSDLLQVRNSTISQLGTYDIVKETFTLTELQVFAIQNLVLGVIACLTRYHARNDKKSDKAQSLPTYEVLSVEIKARFFLINVFDDILHDACNFC